MKILDDIKLDEYESEDIFDVVARLQKSFALKFDKNAFNNVKTFGDMCDVIESHIKYTDQDDCTKQQAFYKIRAAISETQLIDTAVIGLDTSLVDLFPRHTRRTQVKQFKKQLGVNIEFLTYPDWLSLTFIVGVLSSFVGFFFDWRIAVSGIAFFIVATKVAGILGKDLKFDTVKELTEKAVTEHYIEVRHSKLTVNKKEIMAIIIDAFSEGLSIDKEHLTKDAKFSWT